MPRMVRVETEGTCRRPNYGKRQICRPTTKSWHAPVHTGCVDSMNIRKYLRTTRANCPAIVQGTKR
eukprot:1260280-Pleurochrysis_carterae.AAC.7